MTEGKEELKPLNCDMNACRWAEEFMRCIIIKNTPIDSALMIGWFANAIMCGYDNKRWELESKLKIAREALEAISKHQLFVGGEISEFSLTKFIADKALKEIGDGE